MRPLYILLLCNVCIPIFPTFRHTNAKHHMGIADIVVSRDATAGRAFL